MDDTINNIINAVEASNEQINNFVIDINNVTFGADNIITKVVGTFRYLVGEPIFMLFVTIISISIGFMVYKLLYKIFKLLTSLIPGFGKINLN